LGGVSFEKSVERRSQLNVESFWHEVFLYTRVFSCVVPVIC
jgi:hypothetical protein